jgi:hypothetical protein
MVADIVPYLLQASHCREVTYGIAKHFLTFQSQPGGNSYHVLFSYSDVDVLLRESGSELLHQPEAHIGC